MQRARRQRIAAKLEVLFSEAAATQRDLLAKHSELPELNRSLFAGRPLAEQFTIQARGERFGAATRRSFARHESDVPRRETLLACAELEEQSARVPEALLERPGDGDRAGARLGA